jgi:ADP-ribose pyrophosphatase
MPSPRKIFQAKRFAVEEIYEPLADGRHLARHIVRHPGAVVVLPILDDARVCLIRTFRAAINCWNLELPAGTLDKSLPPREVAHLELKEETGYSAQNMTHLHTFCMSPGILDERMHFFVATGLREGECDREEGEQMTNQILHWAEIDRLLRDHQIIDAKTLVALLWYLRYRAFA